MVKNINLETENEISKTKELVNACYLAGNYNYADQIDLMIKIEEFVLKIIEASKNATTALSQAKLIELVKPIVVERKRIHEWVNLFDDEYEYSPLLKLFFQSCFDLRIQDVWLGSYCSCLNGKTSIQLYGELLERIANKAKDKAFIKQMNAHQHKWSDNYHQAKQYVEHLFARYSRLMVLRVDLGYVAPYRRDVPPEQARDDFAKFLNNYRHNKALSTTLKGYIWKLEYGYDKGCHFHLMLFYDGSKVQQDMNWAQRIGEYWVQSVGQHKGFYWNCNANKSDYMFQGIGTVNRNDHERINNLLQYALAYLFKTEQYIMAIPAKYTKLRRFGRGTTKTKQTQPLPLAA